MFGDDFGGIFEHFWDAFWRCFGTEIWKEKTVFGLHRRERIACPALHGSCFFGGCDVFLSGLPWNGSPGGPGVPFCFIWEAICSTFGTFELFWAVFFQVRFSGEIRMSFPVVYGRFRCHGGGAGGPTIPSEVPVFLELRKEI